MHTLITLDADYWLGEFRRRRWQLHPAEAATEPRAVFAAVLTWPSVHDVVIVWDETTAIAYRTPRGPGLSEFAPTHVVAEYSGPATWVLRWILTLSPPGNEIPPLRPVPPDFALPKRRRQSGSYPRATAR
ncbi:hypothetical protein SAMN05216174_12125 [Actinokineospora iranica]|uniref:Uncharacterized protein n=1 Tax=Actinokineospora iranica TaxID=1271860 RepID=A0A1G6YDA2_9PSEU|nr:hypothetical protein SAMN05216174_12125 [Actinokineospora iranica]